MNVQKHPTWSRREFLHGLTIAGGAALLGLQPRTATAEPPPETTTIRLIFDPEIPALCYAPQYVAEQFLGIEGFTEVRYVPFSKLGSETNTLVAGEADISASLVTDWAISIDRKLPIVVLTGLHVGCIEVFANARVRTIRDLKGKRVGVTGLDDVGRRFIATFAAYIGLDPNQDIEWVRSSPNDWARMLAEGEVDAIPTFPPMGYDLHARKIGHVILNTTTDEPWRYYFCCMIAAHREFEQNHPIATKRALRAILKANQLCSLEPERTAQWLVNKGYASNYDYAQKTLREIPYSAWRSYDPEDSLRFYALRLREAGLIKNTPQEIIARGTDWRFLNEIKRELKA